MVYFIEAVLQKCLRIKDISVANGRRSRQSRYNVNHAIIVLNSAKI